MNVHTGQRHSVGIVHTTEHGRIVHTTEHGRIVHTTEHGRILHATEHGRIVHTTEHGRIGGANGTYVIHSLLKLL